jgi:hypothetical protein
MKNRKRMRHSSYELKNLLVRIMSGLAWAGA